MTALVLDAGALIAVDRGDRDVQSKIEDALRVGDPIEPITREDGYRAGELLGTTRTKDVVDATVALLARSDDEVYTSDPRDLRLLCAATGFKAVVISC
jgi:hypothetical protein